MTGILDRRPVARHHGLMPDGLKSLGDATQITHPVVDNGNHVPFSPIEGCNNTATGFAPPLLSHRTKEKGQATETARPQDRKSTRLNSSHPSISYAVFGLKKKSTIGVYEGRYDDGEEE